MTTRYFGQRIKRNEDPRLLTGQGLYVDDVELPDMLHAAFVRSPYAHARLLRVDGGKAEQLPGVFAVVTREDQTRLRMFGAAYKDQSIVAVDKVRYAGDPVAAENYYQHAEHYFRLIAAAQRDVLVADLVVGLGIRRQRRGSGISAQYERCHCRGGRGVARTHRRLPDPLCELPVRGQPEGRMATLPRAAQPRFKSSGRQHIFSKSLQTITNKNLYFLLCK